MQYGVRSTGLSHSNLQLLLQNTINQAEETDEIGFAGTIGANQHIQAPQFQIAFRDGLVAAQDQARNLVGIVDFFYHVPIPFMMTV